MSEIYASMAEIDDAINASFAALNKVVETLVAERRVATPLQRERVAQLVKRAQFAQCCANPRAADMADTAPPDSIETAVKVVPQYIPKAPAEHSIGPASILHVHGYDLRESTTDRRRCLTMMLSIVGYKTVHHALTIAQTRANKISAEDARIITSDKYFIINKHLYDG